MGGSLRDRARQQAEQVLATLERDIAQGRLRAGERMATERELADRFGASRGVIRTALAELHRSGRIDRHVGRGTVVKAQPAARSGLSIFTLQDVSPLELIDVRLAFEPGLAEAIALNGSARDLDAIEAAVAGGDGAVGWEEWERWDRAFHTSFVAASHNRLAIGLYDAIGQVRQQQPWLKAKQGHTTAASWLSYQTEHRLIVERLLARDASGAGAAMHAHLRRVRVKMLGT